MLLTQLLKRTKHILMKMKLLRRQRAGLRPLCLTAFALLAAGTMAPAQTFTYANNDLILGLRKNSPYTENYEVVVDIGQASNYFNLTVGTEIPVLGFSASQLSPGSFASLNNLSWSVFACYAGSSYPGYVNNTLWLTVPRANNAVRSSDAIRLAYSLQQAVKAKMGTIIGRAVVRVSFRRPWAPAISSTPPPLFVNPSRPTAPTSCPFGCRASLTPTQGTLNDAWPRQNPTRAIWR